MNTLMLDAVELSENDFRKISDMVYKHCGINLHSGKKELVRARLAKRLRLGKFKSFQQYMRHVMQDETGREFSLLIDSLSTNLTSFFREQQHFAFIREQLLPAILRRKRSCRNFKIRAWSAGCSSGEEPYSIAITLLDALQGSGYWDIRILATDISTRMLETARSAIYESQRVKPVPAKQRHKYFISHRVNGEKRFEVTQAVRDVVVLRYLNLIDQWPVKGPLDFIFCRNVMIYFDKSTQGRLVNRFWDILGEGGVLFTGHSESLTGISHKFRYIQPTIYMRS